MTKTKIYRIVSVFLAVASFAMIILTPSWFGFRNDISAFASCPILIINLCLMFWFWSLNTPKSSKVLFFSTVANFCAFGMIALWFHLGDCQDPVTSYRIEYILFNNFKFDYWNNVNEDLMAMLFFAFLGFMLVFEIIAVIQVFKKKEVNKVYN